MKAIRIVSNTKGANFALIQSEDGSYGVCKECYSAHVRGGIITTWRYCKIKMTRGEAETMMDRKSKGAARCTNTGVIK